jgi:transcription elongation factor Elf1
MYEADYDCIISSYMKREIGRRKDYFTEVYDCEVCHNDTLVYCENKSECPSGTISYEKWICLSCGHTVASEACNDCEEHMPYSEFNYIFAQAYTDTEKYLFLCKNCGQRLRESEYGSDYEIRN